MTHYRVFPEPYKGRYADRVYYGVERIVRRWFILKTKEILHYFRTEKEAYQFVLECRRKDREAV